MAEISPLLWLQLCFAAGALSFLIMWLMGRVGAAAPATAVMPALGGDTFFFLDDLMVDHTAGALPDGPAGCLGWSDLRNWLTPRFAGLPASLEDLEEGTAQDIAATDEGDAGRLTLSRSPHGTRVTLLDADHTRPAERHRWLMLRAQVDDLSSALDAAPHPIWRSAPDGSIPWRNVATTGAFDPAGLDTDINAPSLGEAAITRLSVQPDGAARPRWYEVHSSGHDWGILHHASDITKVVRAEALQKDFVQTLTKTFAYLTIGLAVFDRTRKLALFNPALVDLTSLGAEFLSGQPDLMTFFDTLRDRRVMPEPRSYASWRTQIGDVIDAAEGGLYQETWSLPNDVTYRVTGRPHPDGAVAFLFEDITAEVMLARRFRSQLDLRQAALDCLPEAVMVIGPNNVLAFCNTAATDLLGIDPDTCFADLSVPDLIHACSQSLPAPAIWSDVEASLRMRTQGHPLRKTAEIAPGHSVSYRIEMLPGAARMLILRSRIESRPQLSVEPSERTLRTITNMDAR